MSIYTVNGSPLKYDNKRLATNGGTPSGELPPYDSSDAGKALVVNNEGDNVEWQTVGSSVTVDQTYDSESSNAQSGTAVAEALSSLATVASTGSYADLNHKPKTKVVLVNAATSYSSQQFYWNLTTEQKAKVAGFTNPLVTVQVSLDLGAELQDDYRMSIMVHGVGDSSWYYYLPNGGTNNPGRELLKGIRYIQESSTGCYGYPIDYVMCQFIELTGGAITFPPSPSCVFTLIVEECET